MVKPMEVQLNAETQAKLARIAAERGSDTQTLAQEAVERFVDHDEWFVREVEKGIAAADLGELVEHEEVGRRIEHRFPT
jgi:predicted transcriptional regulator